MRYSRVVSVIVQPMDLAALVALVNDWGTVPREFDPRPMGPAPIGGAASVATPSPPNTDRSAASTNTSDGAGTSTSDGAGAGTSDGDGEEATAVADRLHAVFAAGDTADRAAAVNAMLTETAVRPELVLEEGSVTGAWRVPHAKDALLASAALALREHLLTRPDRLGVCADRQCADIYVDASPAGHRRFCSVTCQNRTRVAAFRERRRS